MVSFGAIDRLDYLGLKMKTDCNLTIDVSVECLKWIDKNDRVLISLSCDTKLIILTAQEARKLVQELNDKAAIAAMNNDKLDNRTK